MKQRLITGMIAASGFLLLLYLGGFFYLAIIFIMSLIGYVEFLKLNRFKLTSVASWIGMIGMICLVVPWPLTGWRFNMNSEQIVWFIMLGLMAATVLTRNKITLQRVSVLLVGAVYVGFGFYSMLHIRLNEEQFGLLWAVFVFACIWATDSGAYLVGRKFGKTPLCPAISPKKTVEGAVGGLVFALLAASVFSLFYSDKFPYLTAAGLGIVIGCAAQAGDLIQSAYKRAANIKDTGNLLPGHGGILDRCDSWIIVFPLIYFLLGG